MTALATTLVLYADQNDYPVDEGTDGARESSMGATLMLGAGLSAAFTIAAIGHSLNIYNDDEPKKG